MRRKQGISLIVLVITIIVMIILAAAVVITLSNTGVIGRANEAVDKTNLKEVQNLATLVWSEEYMDGKRGDTLKEAVLDRLKDYTGKYDIEVTDKGVNVTEKEQAGGGTNTPPSNIPEDWKASVREVTEDGVPIPIGFVKSPYEGEGAKNTGLVIYALTPTEITEGKTTITDAYQTALETRNQFVWVPVNPDEFKDLFVRSIHGMKESDGTDMYTLSQALGTYATYWELVLDENNMPSQDITNDNISSYVSSTTLAEATAMYASVKKYGGFYIARYEVGTNSTYEDSSKGHIATRVSISGNTNSNLSVTMAKYPYNGVAWGTSMSDETGDATTVSLARKFYPNDTTNKTGVVSTLTYGVQWDRTLAWWKELNPSMDLTKSTSYGVYYDTKITSEDLNANAKYSIYSNESGSYKFGTWAAITKKTSSGFWLLTTGAYKKANVYNIYDMAGSLNEWTMEGSFSDYRAVRGGNFTYSGGSNPVAVRDFAYFPTTSNYYYGFRPSLYIK